MNRFLSCDWGNSRLRLRLVNIITREVSGEVISDDGIGNTYQQWIATGRKESERMDFYLSKLATAVNQLPGTFDKHLPLILSGMASSSIGLAELPYPRFPFNGDLSQWVVKKMEWNQKFSHPVFLVSGFRTDDDVMRGEETLLLGCEIDGQGEKIYIFPGTHSKHVFVNDNTGTDFKTYITGELFSLMTEKSILRNAVQPGDDEIAFAEGVRTALNGNILHSFFRVRTRQLLQGADPVSNYQWLSGLLIGTELKDLKDKEIPVYLVCGEKLKQAYLLALEIVGLKQKPVYLNADDTLIKGHCKIAAHYL